MSERGSLASMVAGLYRLDRDLSVRCNRLQSTGLIRLLVVVSRLGDGGFWYSWMLFTPLVYGTEAFVVSLRMLAAGAVCLPLYKGLKRLSARPRPYRVVEGITPLAAPLDQHAFPSGHTMHAVAFSLVITSRYPETALVLIPFTVLVALSRVVLGLHYPSDVAAGAALGTAVALALM